MKLEIKKVEAKIRMGCGLKKIDEFLVKVTQNHKLANWSISFVKMLRNCVFHVLGFLENYFYVIHSSPQNVVKRFEWKRTSLSLSHLLFCKCSFRYGLSYDKSHANISHIHYFSQLISRFNS